MFQTRDELPSALYSATQVRDIDARLIAAGTPGFELMQRAAQACWRALRRRWPQATALDVLAGSGNNAGDGYLLATLAHQAGWAVRVLAVGDPQRLAGDARLAFEQAQAAGLCMLPWSADSELSGVLIDALLGTGLSGEVRGPCREAIEAINASGLPVLAVDIPSGLCADSGQVLGCAVRADLTVTFIGLKFGLFNAAGPECVGELRFDDLRADPAVLASAPLTARRLTAAGLQPLPARRRDAHKGDFGRLLVIGGDSGTGGAALLAAQSALRCGAGLVSVATREAHVGAFLARCPELMVRGLASANQALPLVEAADVLVVGPGLGQGAWGRSLLSVAASRSEQIQVWDADALNLLAAGAVQAPAGLVLTPHPGEAARLLGWSGAEVQADRPQAALELARKFAACVVLKGAGTLIATPEGELALCDHGHPAMAGAGLGDVLAGIIGALLAQGLSTAAAARLAVWLHARAGERLGREGRGIAASDLIAPVRELLEEHSPCLS